MASLLLRVRVALLRRRLDAALADGADPAASPELTLRARQLTSGSAREALADSIDSILSEVDRPGRSNPGRVPVVRQEVLGARPRLIDLERRLREGRCRAQGVVLIRRLLSDGTGPLYARAPRGTLFSAAWRAGEKLEPS
jgi:hypothetical protein